MNQVAAVIETPREGARRLCAESLNAGFTPTALYCYTDKNGLALYYRIRCDHPDMGEKWIRPMYLDGDKYVMGEPPFSGPKPLYNLHEIHKRPTEPVIVVEGEKCVDVLSGLGILATTSGASTSAKDADWSVLQGRKVTVWADYDNSGFEYAAMVADKLKNVAQSVRLVDVNKLDLDAGGDVADWIAADPSRTASHIWDLPTLDPYETCEGTRTRCLGDVKPERLEWLWPGKIPVGKLTMLAGDPGLGKSLVTLAVATALSLGSRWPVEGSYAPCGDTIFLSAEDDAADTLVPRLIAASANLNRIHILDAVRRRTNDGATVEGTFDLSRDITSLESEIARRGNVKLIVIDPISAYLGGGTDSHKNAEVRGLLAPLAALAQRHRLAVLMVSHLNKGQGSAMYRTMGSLAFVAAARAAFLVTKDKDNPSRRLVLPQKNNLASDCGGLAYHVGAVDTEWGEQPVLEWESEAVDVSADEALAEKPGPDADERKNCQFWLRSLLSERGPMQAKEITDEAVNGNDFCKATLKRAKKALGIQSYREDNTGPWWWRLPQKVGAQVRYQGSQHGYLEHLEPLEENQGLTDSPDTPKSPGAQVSGGRGNLSTWDEKHRQIEL